MRAIKIESYIFFCFSCVRYSKTQQPLETFSRDKSAALDAASKTLSTFSPVNAEHSKYFRAPICFAITSAYYK